MRRAAAIGIALVLAIVLVWRVSGRRGEPEPPVEEPAGAESTTPAVELRAPEPTATSAVEEPASVPSSSARRESVPPDPTPAVSIHVTRRGAGPAVGASVEVGNAGRRARGRTDAAGRARLALERWPAHEVVVIPAEPGWEWKRFSLADRRAEMEGPVTLTVEVELASAGRARVTLVSTDGARLSGHSVQASYLSREDSAQRWSQRIGFTDAEGVLDLPGLAPGEWAFETPEWRNFAQSEHVHEGEHSSNEHRIEVGQLLEETLEVRARDVAIYASGRFSDLAGKRSLDGLLRDYQLEQEDGRGGKILYADGAFFLFGAKPWKVRVKELSSGRTSRWLELAPGVHLGDLTVPW